MKKYLLVPEQDIIDLRYHYQTIKLECNCNPREELQDACRAIHELAYKDYRKTVDFQDPDEE